MPNGSSHEIGIRNARAEPSRAFFFLGVVHGTDVAHPVLVDMRDVAFEPASMRLRHIAGDDEARTDAAGDLDRDMRSLDRLDAAEKDQWRVGRRARREVISGERHAVEYKMPDADVGDAFHHEPADRAEFEGAEREPMPENHRSAADLALISHQLRQPQRQNGQEVGDARKGVDDVKPAARDFSRQRRRVAQGVGGRLARQPRPGYEPARRTRTGASEHRHLVAAALQPSRQHVHDPLDAAVMERGHGQFGIGGEGDAQISERRPVAFARRQGALDKFEEVVALDLPIVSRLAKIKRRHACLR